MQLAFLPINEDPYFQSRSKVISTTLVKVPNLVLSTQSQHPQQPIQPFTSSTSMPVKQEPESPSAKHFTMCQTTEHPQTQPINFATTGSSITEINHELKDNNDSPKSTNNASDSEEKQFVLAPTPAQLGKAPLQRRKNTGSYQFFIIWKLLIVIGLSLNKYFLNHRKHL